MPSNDTPIDFSAPAVLRKWPSKNNERNAAVMQAEVIVEIARLREYL